MRDCTSLTQIMKPFYFWNLSSRVNKQSALIFIHITFLNKNLFIRLSLFSQKCTLISLMIDSNKYYCQDMTLITAMLEILQLGDYIYQ